MKPERCGDTIRPENFLWEMILDQLEAIYSLNSSCDCAACRAVCEMVTEELKNRKIDLK